MSILSNYKIIKELGKGMIGTVYLIEPDPIQMEINKKTTKKNIPNQYALKIEHIEPKDTKPNSKSEVWREINFYKNFAYKYPEQFIQMLEYDFIDNCKHIQHYPYSLDLFPKQVQNQLKKKATSKYCIRKIFDLVDGNLNNLIDKLNSNQIYSMIIQITWEINLLHSNGYTHGDLHSGNIGWLKTSKKTININGLKIKTFGYQIKLIDFGLVMSKYDTKTKKEEKKFNELINTELSNIKYFLADTKLWDWMDKNNIKWDYDKTYSQIKKIKEFEIIKKFTTDKQDQIFLFDILFPELFQKIICGDKFKKIIKRKLFIPVEDILVLVKMSSNSDLIIKYFYDKINHNQ